MKKSTSYILLSAIMMLATISVAAAPNPPAPQVTITLLDPLPTELAVGEAYTVRILVESDIPFIRAMAMNGAYFPAYLATHGGDGAGHASSAILAVTFIGRRSTAELPNGQTISTLHVCARYGSGVTVVKSFEFAVAIR